MKKFTNKSNRTKFSQNLRKVLVSLAEDSLKSGDTKFISKEVLSRMKSSM